MAVLKNHGDTIAEKIINVFVHFSLQASKNQLSIIIYISH